jgi:hypothetical protein
MITLREIRSALTGAIELARGDIIGLSYFENSAHGAWRSFWAALVVAPAWVFLLAVDQQPITAGPAELIAVQTIDYALLWSTFPLVLYEILSRTGHADRLCLYISMRNWASVIETPAMLFAAAFAVAVPYDAAQVVPLLVMVLIFAYEWFLARVGLKVGLGAAAAVAALDFLLSLVIQLTADLLLGAGAVIDAGVPQP